MSLRSYILLFVVPIPQVRPGSHQHFRAFPGPPPVLRSSSEKWKFRNPLLGPFRASSRDLPSGRCLREAEVGYLPGIPLISQFAIWVFLAALFRWESIFRIFKYSNITLGYSSIQISKYFYIQIFAYLDIQIFEYSNIGIFQYSNMQICKYSAARTNIQICKYPNIQIFIQICERANVQICERSLSLIHFRRWFRWNGFLALRSPPAPIAEFEIAAFCNFRHSAGLSPAQFDPMSPFVPILALRINERRGDTQTCKYSDIQTCKDANTQTR